MGRLDEERKKVKKAGSRKTYVPVQSPGQHLRPQHAQFSKSIKPIKPACWLQQSRIRPIKSASCLALNIIGPARKLKEGEASQPRVTYPLIAQSTPPDLDRPRKTRKGEEISHAQPTQASHANHVSIIRVDRLSWEEEGRVCQVVVKACLLHATITAFRGRNWTTWSVGG